MTAGLVWVLVGIGFAVVTLRRRTLAVGLVTAQALMLAAVAFGDAEDPHDLLAAVALAARGLGLAAFLLLVIARTRDPRLVRSAVRPLSRAALAIALALVLGWLTPVIGLASRDAERGVLTLVACGLVLAATSRATVFQILGVVLVENGLALVALELPGTSWLVEVGVALDLTLVALVAGVFHERIFMEFGAGDTDALRSLRD